jgi:hypothetical protein
MGLDRFFDEDNIVKKEPATPVEQPIVEQPKTEVVNVSESKQKSEKPKKVRKKKEETVDKPQEIVEDIKQQAYQEVINQIESGQKEDVLEYPDREQDLQNMLQKVYQQPNVPVYNVSKDLSTGQVRVEARKKDCDKGMKPEPPKTAMTFSIVTPKQQQVKSLLDRAIQDIVRIGIEIEVGLELIKMEANVKNQSLIEAKLTALKNDLDYQQKRRLILERMLQGD